MIAPAVAATPAVAPASAPAASVEAPAPKASKPASPAKVEPPDKPEKHAKVLEVAMRLDNDQTMLVRMVARVSQWFARAFASVSIEGLEHVPRKGAVILAINHASNFDPILAGAWVGDALKTRRIHWLGKRELFFWRSSAGCARSAACTRWTARRRTSRPIDSRPRSSRRAMSC
ncbi:MAG: 1-acyl-sn-glycerol-3-phosphate acyltransferase [Chloroflexota bacterium]